MKTVKAAKDQRRARRKAKGARHDDPWSIRPIGGTMDPELLRSIRAATRDLDAMAP